MKNRREFRVTMIDNTSLLARLARELRFLVYQLSLAWIAWKRDPIGFSRRTVLEGWLRLRQTVAPNGLASLAVATIAAARLIRFRPATRDGRPVNVYMQLEYNFNLY